MDAARGSATDFYWRVPTVVSNSTATGTFDATALNELAIEICKLNSAGTACSGSLVARYTSSGSTRIQLDASSEEYSVSWRTSSSLSSSAFYRVKVFRNGIEIGLTDVDIVGNTSGLSAVDRSRYVGVVRGASLDLRFRVLQSVATSVIRVNEIESNLGTPGDWVELYNAGPNAMAIGGLQLRDNDDTHRYNLPANASIAAGGYYLIDEAALGFGLGAPDNVRLFSAGGALLDSFSWTAHPTHTFGRCSDGSGVFSATSSATKGFANQCAPSPPPAPTLEAWPGSATVQTADVANMLGGNMSGLAYERSGSATAGTLWVSKNGPGMLYRLIWNGATWTPDQNNGWSSGKTLRYPNGSGSPDAEGVTIVNASGANMYVATERNNDASATSRNSILLFNTAGSGTTLVATREWNVTSDLPAVGSNTGLEAITWVPDTYLVARGFHDERRNAAYDPAQYPNHGDGLFLVGLEANGRIYAYALNHADGTFARVASFASGFTSVMSLEFDIELNQLWATCDDSCSGRSAILGVDTRIGSTTPGRFSVMRLFLRPTGMSNLNNEGFAVASQAECVSNQKPVFWADDAATSGFAIRRGMVNCTVFAP